MNPAASVISRRHLVHWPFEGRTPSTPAGAPIGEPSTATSHDYWIRVHRRAMACRFEVTLAGEHAAWVPEARRALEHVDAIEARLTVFRDSSDVVRLNRTAAAGPVAVDEDLFALLQLCREVYRDTDGAFDITSAPLSRCWGFLRREGRLPGEDEIASVLRLVGMPHVAVDSSMRRVYFDSEGVALNFGAVGKGWALDRLAGRLAADGVAQALLSAGRSSVRTVGMAPGSTGGVHPHGWPIDLTSPRVEPPLAHVSLRSGALGTSGAGEQFFEVDGRRYGHVIDPRTGWPTNGVLSVTVIASDAARADALSTAFFVGGIDLARRYCDHHPSVLAIVTADDARRRPTLIGEFAGAHVEVA